MDLVRNRLFTITIVSVIFFFSLLYLSAVSSYWKITPDSATYVLTGESIAAGEGYKEMGKSFFDRPPVTPLIFSIFVLLFPDSYLPLNAVTTIFALLSLSLAFILFKGDIGSVKGLIIILLSIGSTLLFQQSTLLLSDIFYMFFSILALVMTKRISEKDCDRLNYALLGAVVLIACMTRTVGITLVLAILIYSLASLLKKRTRVKPFLVLVMLLVTFSIFLWEFTSLLAGGDSLYKLSLQNEPWVEESGYISLIGLAKRFYMNLGDYRYVGTILTNDIFGNFAVIHTYGQRFVLSLLCLLFFLGLLISMWNMFTVTGTYTIVYLLIIGLYHPWIEIRWFLPVLPFLFYYLLIGLECVIEKARTLIGPFTPKIIYAVAVIYVICYSGYGMTYMLRSIPEEHKSPFGTYPIKYLYNYDTQRLAMWLKDNSAHGESYVCQHPDMTGIFTERRGYHFPLSRDSNRLLDLLKKERIRYVLADKRKTEVQKFLLPVINTHPNQFNLIRDEKGASLYEFKLQESFSGN